MEVPLEKKVEQAIKLLQSIPGTEIELCFSGGKDSSVILELAKMAKITYRAIYKKTTLDPIGTIKFCRDNGCEIVEPKMTFFELIKHRGFPTRRCRFCCEVLKEYKILDHAIQGIRVCESKNRERIYKEPQICRIYGNNKKNNVKIYLPILHWTDTDVEKFIRQRNIKCHPSYYDSEGNFHVERRLGCISCPLPSDNGLSDFVKNPKFVKRYIECGIEWWNKPRKKEIASKQKFDNVYNLFFHNLFCKSYSDYLYKTTGMFGNLDCKKTLEDYFKIEL